MKKVMQRLRKSSFIKNVAIMASGTAGAQFVTMALSPVITRLYGPDAFGIMGTFTALTRVIIPIVALTYPIAIVLPKSDKNAKGLIKLSLYITFIIAILATVILLLFNKDIVDLFQIQEIGSFLYLLPLVIIFAGLVQVVEQWLIRTSQFAINAKANSMQSILTNGSKAGIGLVYPTATALVILQILGNGIKAVLMIIPAKKSGYNERIHSDEEIFSLNKLAKKYKDFPMYRAPQALLGSFSENLPILLLTTFFGPVSAGYYNIGKMVLGLPSRLIGKSIGDVFYPRIAKAANEGENINQLIIKATGLLGAIGVIPFGIVIIFGPSLFELVFGSGWDVAGEYARWISLTSFAILTNKPAVKSMPVLNVQRFFLLYSITLTVVRISGLAVGFYIFDNDIIAIALFSISNLVLHACLFLITLGIGKKVSQ